MHHLHLHAIPMIHWLASSRRLGTLAVLLVALALLSLAFAMLFGVFRPFERNVRARTCAPSTAALAASERKNPA